MNGLLPSGLAPDPVVHRFLDSLALLFVILVLFLFPKIDLYIHQDSLVFKLKIIRLTNFASELLFILE